MALGPEYQSRGGVGQSEIGTEEAGLGCERGLGGAWGKPVITAAEEGRKSEQIEVRPHLLHCAQYDPGEFPSVDGVAGLGNRYRHSQVVVCAHVGREGCSPVLGPGTMTAAQTEAHDSPARPLEGT